MVRVYLDNNVVSGIARRDLSDAEMRAVDQLLAWQKQGIVALATSRHSQREMERAPVKYQPTLIAGLKGLGIAPDDHRVLGFHTQVDRRTCTSCPLVTDIVDEPLFADLLALGLERDDAQHLMYAVHNGYERFITLDGPLLARRQQVEARSPAIRVVRPSELVAELSGIPGESK